MSRRASLSAAFALVTTIAACAGDPPPIVIHEEPSQSIWLKFDPRSGEGHSHPATITPEQMSTVLRGVRVRGRDVVGGFGYFADQDSAPAFLPMDIPELAARLSLALSKASPKDMATFYLTSTDLNRGKLITSGGVFVRGPYLMLILANAHTSPYSVQYENTSTIDTRDQPLLPIARFKFTAEFIPPDVRIPIAQVQGNEKYEGYVDNSKLLVLDLARLRSHQQDKR
jgi:hypothetical protein